MLRPQVVPRMTSQLGIDWDRFRGDVNQAVGIWNAYNQPPAPAVSRLPQPVFGGSTGTLLLMGGALLLGYAVLSKKGRR